MANKNLGYQFVAFPFSILMSTTLRSECKVVLGILINHERYLIERKIRSSLGFPFDMTYGFIADHMDVGVETIRKNIIPSLEKSGLIKKETYFEGGKRHVSFTLVWNNIINW